VNYMNMMNAGFEEALNKNTFLDVDDRRAVLKADVVEIIAQCDRRAANEKDDETRPNDEAA
jgi:hypothetical protein